MAERHVVIGGNAAGMTAASRAKRLAPDLAVTILEAGPYISYSICGLPYWLGGQVSKFSDLVLFTPEKLRNERGIEARLLTRAVEILPSRRAVVTERVATGEREILSYDKLLVATGYRPKTPKLSGIDSRGVFTASHVADGEAIAAWLDGGRRQKAALIGGGYIGLEMAEALRRRGLDVTLVEKNAQILRSVDADLAELVQKELEQNGVRILTGRAATRILARGDGTVEAVEVAAGSLIPADLVFVDVGVVPRVDLATSAGIRLGPSGAIAVDETLATNVPAVYAAGNCAELTHLVTGRPFFDPLGTVAAKQGRVAGENMAGRRSRFRGALGTAVVKVFGLTAARTGLTTARARREGFSIVDGTVRSRFSAGYLEGGDPGTVKVIVERESRRLLGAQIIGSAAASARINALATAITARLTVDDAAQLDFAYAPPVGALWDPVLIAMNAALKKLDH